ncbi:MAG: carboxypeptidase-like regulatory domain-containing protein, partial [Thermoplasmata archaeon]
MAFSGQPVGLELTLFPPTGQVAVDGISVAGSAGLWSLALPPGEHSVRASAAGYLARTVSLELRAGQNQTLDLRLDPEPGKSSHGASEVTLLTWRIGAGAAAAVAMLAAMLLRLGRR